VIGCTPGIINTAARIIPASKAAPRFVSPEAIAAFEANNPALSGIGEVMLERGLWVLTNSQRGRQK
jgi:hypothetical protein